MFACVFTYANSMNGNAVQGYGWLKDRILGEEGRRQQMQLRELSLIAEQLGCSLAQLAIGQSIIIQSSFYSVMSILIHSCLPVCLIYVSYVCLRV